MPAVHDALDLNLLRVLGALLDEQHLTRAGRRLGMTQSATSHALARLRRFYGDPLFVRTPRGLSATARAAALAEPVREALQTLERCVVVASFDPARASERFTFATSDYGAFVLAPRLIEHVARAAPGVDLVLRSVDAPFEDQLVRGGADVTVLPTQRGKLAAGLRSRLLWRERFVCLVRRDHPQARRKLDLAAWLAMRHVLVAPGGRPGGVVDEALGQLGERRRVAVTVPHFLLAPHVVAGSDLVLTVGVRVAEAFAELLPLRVIEPPVKLPTFEVRMYWHERQHRSPGQEWFREAIRTASSG